MPQQRLTNEQAKQTIAALDAHGGNVVHAAKALGIARGTMQNRVRAAQLQGIDPKPRVNITGTSTLYGADGQTMLQWVKSDNAKGPDEWAAAVKEVFADVNRVKPIAAPRSCDSKLLTVYPIGDHHVAMYAWAEEVGADYDIKIADRLLTSAAHHLVDVSPPSEKALIINLGDFFHVDNLKNETSRSGNTLDMDTRYKAMIRAGVKMLRAVIETALTKHKQVHVICSSGNHDDLGSLWLALTLNLLYERNPRVTVEDSPSKFHYYRHGTTFIGVTHGDTGKPEKLQGVMAADRPVDWGETKFRYWMTGHVHTRKVLEFPGVMWETFRTLAPGDAWSNAAAYRSGRDMTSIVFSDKYGEVARHRFDVGMLE